MCTWYIILHVVILPLSTMLNESSGPQNSSITRIVADNLARLDVEGTVLENVYKAVQNSATSIKTELGGKGVRINEKVLGDGVRTIQEIPWEALISEIFSDKKIGYTIFDAYFSAIKSADLSFGNTVHPFMADKALKNKAIKMYKFAKDLGFADSYSQLNGYQDLVAEKRSELGAQTEAELAFAADFDAMLFMLAAQGFRS